MNKTQIAFFSIFSSLAYLLSINMHGQTNFQYWNTENGLSNDWVSEISQDREGYIWIATQYGLNRFDGYEFEQFRYSPNDTNSLSANWVRKMVLDRNGTYWLGAYLGGLNSFDPSTLSFKTHPLVAGTEPVINILTVFCDSQGGVWVGGYNHLYLKPQGEIEFKTILDIPVYGIQRNSAGILILHSKDGIYTYDQKSDQLEKKLDFPPGKLKQIFLDSQENLWAFGEDHFSIIEQKTAAWTKDRSPITQEGYSRYFYDSPIFEDSKGQIWVGGEQGVTVLNSHFEEVNRIDYEQFFPKGQPTGKALTFFEDRNQNIWVGTTKGLVMYPPFSERFDTEIGREALNHLTGIRASLQIENYLWVANFSGLYRIDLNQPHEAPLFILNDPIRWLLESSDGHIYAGGRELSKINPITLEIDSFGHDENGNGLKGGIIWSMAEDDNGRIWISAVNMLHLFDPQTETFKYFSKKTSSGLLHAPSQVIMIDSKNRLWAGSVYSGLYMLENPGAIHEVEEADFYRLSYDAENENSLSNKVILALAEGKDGSIWVGTDGGLNKITPETFEVKRYLNTDGLIDEKIMGLLVDDKGFVWGTTIGHGIFRLDPDSEIFTFFNRKDGLKSNNFLIGSAAKNDKGLLFFGSDNGLQQVSPDLIDEAEKPLIPFIFTTNITVGAGFESLNDQGSLSLPYDHGSFKISFSTLNYYQAEKTIYWYQLEGVHHDWQPNGIERSIRFTGLAPGNYTLKIKAENPNLIFETKELRVQIGILPPWWKTLWAYLAYVLLGAIAVYTIYRLQLNREMERVEAERLLEMDTLKTKFFTNITHEFRTPLTVILGLADRIKSIASKEIGEKAQIIRQNGDHLLVLINEILDVSKLDAGKMPVQLSHGNFIGHLHYILSSFQSLAGDKNIRLHFLPDITDLWMDYDEEKIRKIMSNLLSNAIKNTNEGGDVYLQISRKKPSHLDITLRDTGNGIDEASLPFIFDRFYQTENKAGSSGIGLSFTKELLTRLDGKISVDSQKGKETSFSISLPIINEQNNTSAEPSTYTVWQNTGVNMPTNEPTTNTGHSEEIPLILIIEDNRDITNYIVECLKDSYRTTTAANGQLGIEKAMQIIPDLIICDIMMPIKDGFQVAEVIKNDRRTSHIPFVFLTAKADTESKLKGLEHGAEAYLFKPFDQKELEIRIRKLLASRRALQHRFQEDAFWFSKQSEKTNKEDQFVVEVRQIVEKNLNDSDFGILQLCKEVGISRVHLHRKLKALTNLSTSHFIRQIKLQHGRKLLQTTDLNVAEVAYEVGFSDPSYFSRCYSDAFGETPNVTKK